MTIINNVKDTGRADWPRRGQFGIFNYRQTPIDCLLTYKLINMRPCNVYMKSTGKKTNYALGAQHARSIYYPPYVAYTENKYLRCGTTVFHRGDDCAINQKLLLSYHYD